MNKRIYSLGLLGLLSCSSGAGGVRAATAPLAPHDRQRAPVTKNETAVRAPLDDFNESASDRAFIENAERAIGEYSEFIARAGESEEYAAAVKRSREQIEDLQSALVFVRAGAGARAAH